MPNYSKSPNKFLGSTGRALAGASSGGQVGFSGMLGKLAQAAQKRQAGVAGSVPSVVATAGASNMSGRIEGIESRLATLEGGGATAGAAQSAEVAPSETFTDPLTGMEIQRGTTGNEISPEARVEAAQARRDERAMPGTVQPQAPASEVLGSLMASPFTMRQRSNRGPLTFKDQTGDGKITRADVIKARIEGYKK